MIPETLRNIYMCAGFLQAFFWGSDMPINSTGNAYTRVIYDQ